MDTSSKIRRLRLERGLTQKELARKLGARYHYISRWEKGVEPSAKYLGKLAKALDVDIAEFYPTDQSENMLDQALEGKEGKLAHSVAMSVEQALANDPCLRLIIVKLKDIGKRLEELEKGQLEVKKALKEIDKHL